MFYELCLNNTKTNTLFWQIIGIYLRTLQALMKGDLISLLTSCLERRPILKQLWVIIWSFFSAGFSSLEDFYCT